MDRSRSVHSNGCVFHGGALLQHAYRGRTLLCIRRACARGLGTVLRMGLLRFVRCLAGKI